MIYDYLMKYTNNININRKFIYILTLIAMPLIIF